MKAIAGNGQRLPALLVGAILQSDAEILVRCLEATVDIVDIDDLGVVDVFQRRSNGLNLQHAIGNDFAFKFGQRHSNS
jgi:hypothetical protein